MDKIAETFKHIKGYNHCELCPGQFGWIPEKEIESLEIHYKMFHLDKKSRTEEDFNMGN